MRKRRRLTPVGAVLLAAMILGGCTTAALPPTYTQVELKTICERNRGWWHPDDLVGGFCETFP
jgi:hypothetical protein